MKITPEGIAVVEGDSHLSKWVMEQGRLDIQRERALIEPIRDFIPAGGWAVDIGACLGDHTTIYADLVGPSGRVNAFEPNAVAYECLVHNMRNRLNVQTYPCALGAQSAECTTMADPTQPENLGMTTLGSGHGTFMQTLDSVAADWPRLDFMKIDAEGFELDILLGAKETIRRFHPPILMEVNVQALANHGTNRDALYVLLNRSNYRFAPYPFQGDDLAQRIQHPEIDVFCLPVEKVPAGCGFLSFTSPFLHAVDVAHV